MVNAIQLAEHSDIHGSPAPAGQDRFAVQLQQAGIKGELTKLKQVAQDFDNDVLTLNLLAAYLNRWYAGRLNGLETIPVLLHSETTGQGLRRILAAFEAKLHGTSDITLLYLLTLSDRPVVQRHMQVVFRSSFIERWLTKRDDYVRFLGPLGRLNEEHWHWVIENLRRLHLLESPIAKQPDLLVVAEPIRTYFRNKLQLRNQTVFKQGSADMEKLSRDTVVEFRQRYQNTPEIKSWISPELCEQLEQEVKQEAQQDNVAEKLTESQEEPVRWRHEELSTAQEQLAGLRKSLAALKAHTQKLAHQLSDSSVDTLPADGETK
ncbi:MAG: hypothetical protein CSA79_01870 [Thiothrix nivea]|nr:MAG: hypothetical protein CSA79_01870 [Thiothrix nivea]